MSDPSVLQDIEKKRNCSLQYSAHLRPLWRGSLLLLTAIQLHQSKPVGFQPCSLSPTWAHHVLLVSSPFSAQCENWWLGWRCKYIAKSLAKSGNKAQKARLKPILSLLNPDPCSSSCRNPALHLRLGSQPLCPPLR